MDRHEAFWRTVERVSFVILISLGIAACAQVVSTHNNDFVPVQGESVAR